MENVPNRPIPETLRVVVQLRNYRTIIPGFKVLVNERRVLTAEEKHVREI
jgi:hypothetical protein